MTLGETCNTFLCFSYFLPILSLLLSRERVTLLTTFAENSTRQVTDTEILNFYNLATSKLLTALEVRLVNQFFLEINAFYVKTGYFLGRSI